MSRLAVVLLNLGGPDSPEAVKPFLFNLFNDPAIIGLPQPMRWLLAKLISGRRAPLAREIYDHLGGGSPLLPNTEQQARALEESLAATLPGDEARVFISMRYWHPFSRQTAAEVAAFAPDEIVLLPLYPQFSTTTTRSSLRDWARAAKSADLKAPTQSICCYPVQAGFVDAAATLIRDALGSSAIALPRILFSAHGLPKKIIAAGDPYQWQVEQTAAAIVERLSIDGLDWTVCYQSRVGPLEWIGPSTDAEIQRAGAEGVPIVIVPIAFVSEHSETLVELDIEYRKLADESGVSSFSRVPTVSTQVDFIAGLAALVIGARGRDDAPRPDGGVRLCPAEWNGCPCAVGAAHGPQQ